MRRLIGSVLLLFAVTGAFASTNNSYRVAITTNSIAVVTPPISSIVTNVSGNYTNMVTNTTFTAYSALWIHVVGDNFYCDTDPDSGGATTNSALYSDGTYIAWGKDEMPLYVKLKTVSTNATVYVQRKPL